MERAELEKILLNCVSVTYKKAVEELSMATDMNKELGGASIMKVGLASLIENELDVLVPLPTVAACATLKDLADKIEELM